MTAQQPATLLVVDDNEAARHAKARTLRRAGFEVVEAGTAAQAWHAITQTTPSLVLLDVNLPDRSGWDVCRQIKSDPATSMLPVLQMSASYVTEADTVRALEGGADACLTEPVEAAVLIATVRALLRTRRAEEALRGALGRERVARMAAEMASRTKDEFLATLSHELRSPLNAILSWVTLARSGRLEHERSAHALEVIERNARLQVRMIEELLDVSRIVSGKTRLEVAVLDLAPIARAALEGVQLLADQKQIRLIPNIDSRAGPIAGDATRLQQVFANLLSNAVKFTPKGGSVELRVANEGDATIAAVIDSGRGIAAEFLPHIFERFRQADASTTRAEGGLGLGLAIVRHLVALHGGSVSVDSPGLGKGSVFRVQLPTVDASAQRAARDAESPAADVVDPSPDLHGVAILLLDDDSDAREGIALVLAEYGARVIQTSSAEEALRLLAEDLPDVVISDIAMPVEDGYSFVSRLRGSNSERIRTLPVIALTAYNYAEDRRRMTEAGFDMQLAKPIELDTLTTAVSRVVGRRRGAAS
jgi:signal transduction histidine kinase